MASLMAVLVIGCVVRAGFAIIFPMGLPVHATASSRVDYGFAAERVPRVSRKHESGAVRPSFDVSQPVRHSPPPSDVPKAYDRAYFDRWYRDPTDRVSTRDSLERKVRMAVSVTEFLIGRKIRSVLDVGCGEAPWQPLLQRIRPNAYYIGVESSDYVIERYGESRNIQHGTLGRLHTMGFDRGIDLIVCADVLQYVETRDVERGLRTIRRLVGGVAYIEAFTTEDAMEGDHDDWHERSAAEYRRLFRGAGLTRCGPYCFTNAAELNATTFELL